MYSVIFLKGNKRVFEKEFQTQNEAEDFVLNEVTDYPYEYQIYDITNDLVVDEGELESDREIEMGNLDMMFGDEESKEGFSADEFFDNE